MKKAILLTIALAVVFVLGFILLRAYYFIPQLQKQREQSASPEAVSVRMEKYSEENKANNYRLQAEYPQFSGISNKDKINKNIKDAVFAVLGEFKKNAGTQCNFKDIKNGPDWVCETDIVFDKLGANNFYSIAGDILSIEMESYGFTGGAHGDTSISFLNYDMKSGDEISWKSVFKINSKYLEAIADYSKMNLGQQLLSAQDKMTDEKWIEQGTTASQDNYSTNIGFTPDSLLIIFQQYQVAAYAAGPQAVQIPYSQLKIYIDPNGPLKDFAN